MYMYYTVHEKHMGFCCVNCTLCTLYAACAQGGGGGGSDGVVVVKIYGKYI